MNRNRIKQRQTIALKPWLDHLVRHVAVAKRGVDPEGVHQLRVAIAHIRVWLELGGWTVLHDDLRWLRGAAAPVRDLDVQLAHEMPAAYAEELRAERDRAHDELVAALGESRFASIVTALEVLPPLRTGRVRKGIARSASRTLAIGRELPQDGHARAHAVRRSVRRVRFALEWLGEPLEDIARLQDALGEFCDAWVAVRRARRHEKGSEMREHRHALERELREAARAARRAWSRARPALEALA
jgi:CHAD domain-containing protein